MKINLEESLNKDVDISDVDIPALWKKFKDKRQKLLSHDDYGVVGLRVLADMGLKDLDQAKFNKIIDEVNKLAQADFEKCAKPIHEMEEALGIIYEFSDVDDSTSISHRYNWEKYGYERDYEKNKYTSVRKDYRFEERCVAEFEFGRPESFAIDVAQKRYDNPTHPKKAEKMSMDFVIQGLVAKYMEGMDHAIQQYDAETIARVAKKLNVLAVIMEKFNGQFKELSETKKPYVNNKIVFRPKLTDVAKFKEIKEKLKKEFLEIYKDDIEAAMQIVIDAEKRKEEKRKIDEAKTKEQIKQEDAEEITKEEKKQREADEREESLEKERKERKIARRKRAENNDLNIKL